MNIINSIYVNKIVMTDLTRSLPYSSTLTERSLSCFSITNITRRLTHPFLSTSSFISFLWNEIQYYLLVCMFSAFYPIFTPKPFYFFNLSIKCYYHSTFLIFLFSWKIYIPVILYGKVGIIFHFLYVKS